MSLLPLDFTKDSLRPPGKGTTIEITPYIFTQQFEIQLSMICHYAYSTPWQVTTLSRKYSHLNIDSFVEKVALRL